MKLQPHNNLVQAKKDLMPVFSRHLDLDLTKIFIFGSQATGKAGLRSDIDIGIESVESIPAVALINIKEEIENMPYIVDVVDFADITPEFRKLAKKEVILWN